METRKVNLVNEIASHCNFVGDGRGNQQSAYRKLIEAELVARYADQLASTSGLRWWWLNLKSRVALWRALMRIGSDYSLYIN